MSDQIDEIEQQLPPGTCFVYLGRPCVVMHYAGRSEQEHTGRYGLVFEYADAYGVIRKDCITPIDQPAFLKAIQVRP